jgi:serine/threonine protein kinase
VSQVIASPTGHGGPFAREGNAARNDGGALAAEPRRGSEVNAADGLNRQATPPDPGQQESLFAGRYRIESVLGTGGMGVVYAATHVALRLPVALKVVHPSLANSREARARFCIEARAGAALRSPHVLRVYDAGELGGEDCYVVMERLEGSNLDELLEATGPLSVETAVEYVLQACSGLAEAHAIGLVHRDIKPENLFLSHYRCAPPLIKIMDFGIARWHGDEFRGGRLTNPSSSLGSPCYQSPEQMENAVDVDERSDIWSLGLVLFELLTGYCPFEAENLQETCWKVLQGPRPSLRSARPDIDPGLEAVLGRCLALDRGKRFASVKQLASALRPFGARASLAQGSPQLLSRKAGPKKTRTRSSHGRLFAAAGFAVGVACTVAFHAVAPRWSVIESKLRVASNSAVHHAPADARRWLASHLPEGAAQALHFDRSVAPAPLD